MSVKKETYFATVQKTERSTKKKRHLEKNNKSVHLLSHVKLFAISLTAAHQASCPSLTPRACSNSCPSSWWCYSTISSSAVPFSSCLQSFPASGYFLMSQFFATGAQSIGVSASTSVLPMNIQGWFLLELTDWISLQSKGLSRVFSNTTVQKHQFLCAQLSSQSNSHIHTWPPYFTRCNNFLEQLTGLTESCCT